MGVEDDKVLQFLPWAQHFARLCSSKLPPHLEEDLRSAGILGYLQAASRYSADGGASFRGYCSTRIRGAILDEVRHWDWAPRSVHRANRRITRITNELSERLEREPTPHELAHALGIPAHELPALQTDAKLRQLIPLDDSGENGEGEDNLPLAQRLSDPAAVPPDLNLRNREDRLALLRCISRLPKSQATVIVLHYLQNVPLRQVADVLAVTPSRVSQLHRRALGRLRHIWTLALQNP